MVFHSSNAAEELEELVVWNTDPDSAPVADTGANSGVLLPTPAPLTHRGAEPPDTALGQAASARVLSAFGAE